MEKELNLVFGQISKELEGKIESSQQNMMEKIERDIGDKVRVDEVQDALKRLTDN